MWVWIRGITRGLRDAAHWVILMGALPLLACDDGGGESRTVVVELLPAAPGCELLDEVLVRLEPGSMVAPWTAKHPARFEGTRPNQSYVVQLPGRLLHAGSELRTDRWGRARLAIPIVEMAQPEYLYAGRNGEHWHLSKALYIDVTHPEFWRASWREGKTVVTSWELPKATTNLAEAMESEWKHNGSHWDPRDPKRDHAFVLAGDELEFADLMPAVRALGSAQRTFYGLPTEDHGRIEEIEPRIFGAFRVRAGRASTLAQRDAPESPPLPPGDRNPEPSVAAGFEATPGGSSQPGAAR